METSDDHKKTPAPQAMRQSTLVLIMGVMIFGALILPTLMNLLTMPKTFEKEVVLKDGTKIECVVFTDYEAGGIDCFLQGDLRKQVDSGP